MRTKLVIIPVLLIFIGAGYFWFLPKQEDELVSQKEQQESIKSLSIVKDETAQIQKTKKALSIEKAKVTDKQSTAEMKDAIFVYDSDPVVDANMIIENNRMCYGYLSDKYNNPRVNTILQNNLDEKQIEFHQNYFKYCQKLNADNPHYSLTDITVMKQKTYSAKATSLWGDILSGTIDSSELSDYEISDLLKQNNINILSDAPKQLRSYYDKIVHWDLEDVLQNHQYDYVNLIQNYAHNLYLCHMGKDCGPNSSQMAMVCLYLASEACGLTYQQFIEQILTPGQQADISLAMGYFQNTYQ